MGKATFDIATFHGDADFEGASFGDCAGFEGASFGDRAKFGNTSFSDDARFGGVSFGDGARFGGASFGRNANFRDAMFGDRACFGGSPGPEDATLGYGAGLEGAMFGDRAGFVGATFGDGAWFGNTSFGGDANFEGATFGDDAGFNLASFGDDAGFNLASFGDDAGFVAATFGARAEFRGASFGGNARFVGVTFGNYAKFGNTSFGGNAGFGGATFGDDAWFGYATFGASAGFEGASFGGSARFIGAVWERATQLGPMVCRGQLEMSETSFGAAVTMEVAAVRVVCRRTRWASTATLRLRYADVDLSDAVMEYPVSVAAHTSPFRLTVEVAEDGLSGPARVRALSLRGVDAAHLVLTDVDLTECRFAGTVHLDQLRLEGRCPLPLTPAGVRWRGVLPVRWTRRRTLVEEQHWRDARAFGEGGWMAAPQGTKVVDAATLAPVYRALRKSFEDSKNEPGAADFYYGEMEMRRHDSDNPRAERWLLVLYWALSGYGLRASRAIGWLLFTMGLTVGSMMLWGLPKDDPKPVTAGTVAGSSIRVTTGKPDPVNPDGPRLKRVSGERFEKSLQVVVNSVVFRSAGQDLTTAGTFIEMVSRVSEPILLGFAILAVRGRVKR
ncbi:pentapeptide repeat-containing protein [Streptomyces sp. NPDC058690]|uniref:pentapeptide repeat-containing protein n=1 Tax=Streptomyces sp. NPDC058690 TaxID=3346600 RepID=UPI0036550A43